MVNNNLKEDINKQEQLLKLELLQAKTEKDLEDIRVKFLGRNGSLTKFLNLIKNFSLEDKKTFGPLLNKTKQEFQDLINSKKIELLEKLTEQENYKKLNFDVTAYKTSNYGSLHPYTLITEQISDIFISMGFDIVQEREVESDEVNFQALNIPEDHPARDMQDTFWLNKPYQDFLLRTHNSSVEVHVMRNKKTPIAIVAPGRCYRNEATDASHDIMFMQVEGLLIDKNVSLSNLIATLKEFLKALFHKDDIKIRLRPSYFPFVEPGLEVDIFCPFCDKGCSVCKHSKWIEMGGAGLTHPNVLRFNGIDPDKYSGFAFGFGLTRLVMLKYRIPDIRLLHNNKLDFLKQF